MSLCKVEQDTIIFRQGNPGYYFYYIRKGAVELFINGNCVKKLCTGESFGELALLHSAPRSGSIIASTDCVLWCLERNSFRRILDKVSQINFEENKAFVESVDVFASVDEDNKMILCNSMIKEFYKENQQIIKKNDQTDCIYVIKEGTVDVFLNDKKVRSLGKTQVFGDRGLLTGSVRSMTCLAQNSVVCYAISRETLKNMLGAEYKQMVLLNCVKVALKHSTVFGGFNSTIFNQLLHICRVREYSKDDVVIDKHHLTSSELIIIIEGSVVDASTGEEVASKGDILFEKQVYTGSSAKSPSNLLAFPDCLCVRIETSSLLKQIGGSFDAMLNKSTLIESLQRVPLFKNFGISKIEAIAAMAREMSYGDREKIIVEGQEGHTFYIIKKGNIDIRVKGNYVRTLGTDQFFGERALFFKEPRSATAIANGQVQCYSLYKDDFLNSLEENMKEYLKNRFNLQDETVELKDLECIEELGTGNCGVVILVRNKKNAFKYALKVIPKRQIEGEQLHDRFALEKEILLRIDHPFIVKLVKTLKDTRNAYFLLEYVAGKELSEVIGDIGLLDKSQTQFYAGSMLLALEYLHKKKFVYRDVKPENVLVTENGFIKMIDFGSAKALVDRASTIVGTPHYMAPEVVLGEGYRFEVDYWSLAICLFEFHCGQVPFGESAEEPMDVYLEIIQKSETN